MLVLPVLSACGTRVEPRDVAAPPPSAEPRDTWLRALIGLCVQLSGAVSGAEARTLADGRSTPAEILSEERVARPAVQTFDDGLAQLDVPPEAKAADAVLKDFFVRSAPITAELLAAAEAGDQARVTAAVGAREALRHEGYEALYAQGIPEKCTQRGSYS